MSYKAETTKPEVYKALSQLTERGLLEKVMANT
jgi:Fe2+ or Zn2+ uptake regulation protein